MSGSQAGPAVVQCSGDIMADMPSGRTVRWADHLEPLYAVHHKALDHPLTRRQDKFIS